MTQKLKIKIKEYHFEEVELTKDEQHIQNTSGGIEYLKQSRGYYCFKSIDIGIFRRETTRDATPEEELAYHDREADGLEAIIAYRDEVYRPAPTKEPWFEQELTGKEIILELEESE